MHPDLQGVTLDGKYRLIEPIGEGGMGRVWRAEHCTLGTNVAVKLISSALSASPADSHRFVREAKVAASLRGKGVVQIFDVGVHEATPYLVMELLEGETLEQRLAWSGRLSRWQTADLLRQVSAGLERAHRRKIVHRDLKPANIFLESGDVRGQLRVKLLDFGIAKADQWVTCASQATRTGVFLGTPHYSSPEQAQGLKSVDHRADIWSMGVIAFECLIGRPPFRGETPMQVLVEVCAGDVPVPSDHEDYPRAVDAWFARACNRDPAKRYASAMRAAQLLEVALFPDLTEGLVPKLELSQSMPSPRSRLENSLLAPPPKIQQSREAKFVEPVVGAFTTRRLWMIWNRSPILLAVATALTFLFFCWLVMQVVGSLKGQSAISDNLASPEASRTRAVHLPSPASRRRAAFTSPDAGRAEGGTPKGSGSVRNESQSRRGLDPATIQLVIARNTSGLKRSCWQRALRARATGAPSSARVLIAFEIESSGKVVSARATAPRGFPGLGKCLESRVSQWQFSRALGTTSVEIPFMFLGQ